MPSSGLTSRLAVDQVYTYGMSWFLTGAADGMMPPSITCCLPVQRYIGSVAPQ
jgi:hypothetical protein